MANPTTLDEFLASEERFERAAAIILKNGGLKPWSAFLPSDEAGNPDLKSVPDDACFVEFEEGETDANARTFRPDASYTEGTVSEPSGFSGVLKITHRVRVDDEAPKPGESPGCYKRLLRQRGKVRAMFLEGRQPFKELIPDYEILSIRKLRPEKRVDEVRHANVATEIFEIRWMPGQDAWPQ